MSNSALYTETRRRCESLAQLAADGKLPVRLREIATQREVGTVWFQRLLPDGILAKEGKRYAVGIHAEPEHQNRYDALYRDGRDDQLPARQRFALAHELAHTFFYELGPHELEAEAKFAGGGGKTGENILEGHCDEFARLMLLPTPLILPRLDPDFFRTPDSARQLAREARVSPEVLFRRIEDLQSSLRTFAPTAFLLFRRSPEGWRLVRAIYLSNFRLLLITCQKRNDPLETWFKSPESALFSGKERQTDFKVEFKTASSRGHRLCRLITESAIATRSESTTIVSVIDTGHDEWDLDLDLA